VNSYLRNLNLKYQFSIFDRFRDIRVHINDFLKFVGGLCSIYDFLKFVGGYGRYSGRGLFFGSIDRY